MSKVSRRSLAVYAADQLTAGIDAKSIAQYLVAALHEDNKLSEYELLISDVLWELENRQELAVAKVSSAHHLTSQLKANLLEQIKKASKVKTVILDERLDPSLLGGLRIETANKVWDNSVSGKLSELREAF